MKFPERALDRFHEAEIRAYAIQVEGYGSVSGLKRASERGICALPGVENQLVCDGGCPGQTRRGELHESRPDLPAFREEDFAFALVEEVVEMRGRQLCYDGVRVVVDYVRRMGFLIVSQ